MTKIYLIAITMFLVSSAPPSWQLPTGSAAASPDSYEFWRYVATQSGLLVALLVVLWSYKRTLVGELNSTKAERDRLAAILDRSSDALTQTAVAGARQTDATHRLSRTVESLERSLGHTRREHDADR